jgi:hypothetical protein
MHSFSVELLLPQHIEFWLCVKHVGYHVLPFQRTFCQLQDYRKDTMMLRDLTESWRKNLTISVDG